VRPCPPGYPQMEDRLDEDFEDDGTSWRDTRLPAVVGRAAAALPSCDRALAAFVRRVNGATQGTGVVTFYSVPLYSSRKDYHSMPR
jgi:hypothetical protein